MGGGVVEQGSQAWESLHAVLQKVQGWPIYRRSRVRGGRVAMLPNSFMIVL